MAMSAPLYHNIRVRLVGQNGNAFAIIGRVRAAMREAGLSPPEIEEFTTQAMSGDYDFLLGTVLEFVEVE
jgi:hypothetical protein